MLADSDGFCSVCSRPLARSHGLVQFLVPARVCSKLRALPMSECSSIEPETAKLSYQAEAMPGEELRLLSGLPSRPRHLLIVQRSCMSAPDPGGAALPRGAEPLVRLAGASTKTIGVACCTALLRARQAR
jgi:hypothetical protein